MKRKSRMKSKRREGNSVLCGRETFKIYMNKNLKVELGSGFEEALVEAPQGRHLLRYGNKKLIMTKSSFKLWAPCKSRTFCICSIRAD